MENIEFDYSLLRDIHEGTPPVDYTFWWVWMIFAVLLLACIIYIIIRLLPLFGAYIRLTHIKTNNEAFVPLINYWLKETALIMYPRDKIAVLCGGRWLEFLDRPDSFTDSKEADKPVIKRSLSSLKNTKLVEQQTKDSEFEKISGLFKASRTTGAAPSYNNDSGTGSNGTNFSLFTEAWNKVIYDYHNIGISEDEKKMLLLQCKKWLWANVRKRIWKV